jgi:hypothetical protein
MTKLVGSKLCKSPIHAKLAPLLSPHAQQRRAGIIPGAFLGSLE